MGTPRSHKVKSVKSWLPVSYWPRRLKFPPHLLPLAIQAIVIAVGFTLKLNGKTLLLKTLHALIMEHEKLIWDWAGSFLPTG